MVESEHAGQAKILATEWSRHTCGHDEWERCVSRSLIGLKEDAFESRKTFMVGADGRAKIRKESTRKIKIKCEMKQNETKRKKKKKGKKKHWVKEENKSS